MKTFSICKHNPSDKLYFVRYVRPDYSLGDGYKHNIQTSNFYLWSVFNDPVGGVWGGLVMSDVAERITFKWFLLIPPLLTKIMLKQITKTYWKCYWSIKRLFD